MPRTTGSILAARLSACFSPGDFEVLNFDRSFAVEEVLDVLKIEEVSEVESDFDWDEVDGMADEDEDFLLDDVLFSGCSQPRWS